MWSARIFDLRLLAALLLWIPLAGIAYPGKMTKAELALLPAYCPDTMGFAGYGDAANNTSPRAGHWLSLMGNGFWHMHHYCGAQVAIMRAEKHSTGAQARKALLESAVDDIDYAIRNGTKDSGPKFVMLPEIYLKRAQTLARLRQYDEAVASFGDSIAAKPDYWPAYAALADMYKNLGSPEKALEVVEQGLKFAPSSKLLNTMLAELQKSGVKRSPKKPEPSGDKDTANAPEPAPKPDATQAQNPPRAN